MLRRAQTLAVLAVVLGAHARAAAAQGDTLDLVVAATTDVHGRLRGWNYYENRPDPARGLTRAATIVDSLRRADPGRVLLVDAGDLLQGNPLAYVAARRPLRGVHPVIAAMNAMRYDAAAIGNHEFNYGLPLLRRAIGEARFPFLAANARTPEGASAFPGWRIVQRAGLRVGVVGATTPGSNLWDHANLHGRVVIGAIVPSVRAAVDSVRRAGADVVVVLLHSGLDEPSSYDTVATQLPGENVAARVAHEVSGIDLIVYGHTHKQMADTTIAGVLLMQPKSWATSVGVAHLRLVRAGGRWRVAAKWSGLVPCAGHAEDAVVLAATDRIHAATVRWVTTPVGSTPVAWRADSARVADTPLIDFILYVERRAAHADLASTSAFSLRAALDAGPITMAELARLYPYENTLKAVRITGRQLRSYLEHSARYFGTYGAGEPAVRRGVPGYNYDIVAGAAYTIDLSRPVGSRITLLRVHGRPVTDADTFTLAVNNYRQSGGGGYTMLRGAPVVYDGQTEIRELLVDAVRRRGTITPAEFARRNWRIVPAAAGAAAYAAMHTGPSEEGSGAGGAGEGTLPRLRVIATNDLHGALEPAPRWSGHASGGMRAMASAILNAERACTGPCETLLVDAGDLFQGTVESNLAYGAPVVQAYDALGYAASAVGNHEFDWGLDTLRARVRQARFAMLGANVRDTSGHPLPWLRADTLVTRGPIRIGIIGVIGPETYGSIMAANVVGLRFLDPAPIIDSLARNLRARGANVVLVLAHSGAFCDGVPPSGGLSGPSPRSACRGAVIDLAARLREHVDAIVSGHTHTLIDTRVNGIPVLQARSSARAMDVLDLQPLPNGRDSVLDAAVEAVRGDAAGDLPAVDSVLDGAESRAAPLVRRPVARLAVAMPHTEGESAVGDLVADAQRWAGRADVAAVNNGGIRAGLPAGEVTYGELFAVQPFGNALVRLTVTGAALRTFLERVVAGRAPRDHLSGVTLHWDPARPPGARLTGIRLTGGRPLRADGRYTVVLSEFVATGREGRPLASGAIAREVLSRDDLATLIAYLESRPQPVPAPAAARILSVSP